MLGGTSSPTSFNVVRALVVHSTAQRSGTRSVGVGVSVSGPRIERKPSLTGSAAAGTAAISVAPIATAMILLTLPPKAIEAGNLPVLRHLGVSSLRGS